RSGMAEVVKVAAIQSPPLFDLIERHIPAILSHQQDVLEQVVLQAIAAKIHLLSTDPYEADLKRPLNFGHTIGHALETIHRYRGIRHGEAVSIGMAISTRIARARGICYSHTCERIISLLTALGLPASTDVDASTIWGALKTV